MTKLYKEEYFNGINKLSIEIQILSNGNLLVYRKWTTPGGGLKSFHKYESSVTAKALFEFLAKNPDAGVATLERFILDNGTIRTLAERNARQCK